MLWKPPTVRKIRIRSSITGVSVFDKLLFKKGKFKALPSLSYSGVLVTTQCALTLRCLAKWRHKLKPCLTAFRYWSSIRWWSQCMYVLVNRLKSKPINLENICPKHLHKPCCSTYSNLELDHWSSIPKTWVRKEKVHANRFSLTGGRELYSPR